MIKLLSVRQPWAGWIALGIKPIEIRTWPTKYRGPIFIHASMKSCPNARPFAFAALAKSYKGNELDRQLELLAHPITEHRKAVIAIVDLVSASRDSDAGKESPWYWRDRNDENVPWVLDNARRISTPVICPGRLGLWEPWPALAKVLESAPLV